MKESNIIRLSDGAGRQFELAVDGTDLKAREVATWGFETVADLSALNDFDGKPVQMRIADGQVQVRESQEDEWQSACAVSALDSLTPVEAVDSSAAPYGAQWYIICDVDTSGLDVYVVKTNVPGLNLSVTSEGSGAYRLDFGGSFEVPEGSSSFAVLTPFDSPLINVIPAGINAGFAEFTRRELEIDFTLEAFAYSAADGSAYFTVFMLLYDFGAFTPTE
jgi:hypothetical protein